MKVGFFRFKNVRHELLRVPVDDGKPGTLDLHHDLVPLAKNMVQRMEVDRIFFYFARGYWFRPLKTSSVSAPEYIIRYHELITCHLRLLRIYIRVDVDQFDDPICITTAGGCVELGLQGSGNADLLFQGIGLPTEHIRPAMHESLIFRKPEIPS